jgi:trimeric autotransporter adhesin
LHSGAAAAAAACGRGATPAEGGGSGSSAPPPPASSSSSAPPPPPSLAQQQPHAPYRLYTPPADVVRALTAAASATATTAAVPAAPPPAPSTAASGSSDGVADEPAAVDSSHDDASLATRLSALQALALATGGVAPLLEAARLLLAPPVAARPLPPRTAAAVRPFLRALALQFDAVGGACEGPPPGSWAAGSGDADRTRHACFSDLTGGATIEDGAVGRTVRTRGASGHAVLNLGILRGRLEWDVRLDRDTHGEECTCFGFARKPVGPGSYDSSPDMWTYRAYNGQTYAAGAEVGEPRGLVHPGDVVRFSLDTDRREARAWVNGDPQGVLFSGLPADTPLYPLLVFYSTNRGATLLRLAVYDSAYGPALLVGGPPSAAAVAAGPAGAAAGSGGGAAAAAGAAASLSGGGYMPVPAPPKPTAGGGGAAGGGASSGVGGGDTLSGAARLAATVSLVPPGFAGHTAYLAQPPPATPPTSASSPHGAAGSGTSTPMPQPPAASEATAAAAPATAAAAADGGSAAQAITAPPHRALTLRGVRVTHGVSAPLAAAVAQLPSAELAATGLAPAAAGDGSVSAQLPPLTPLLLPRLLSSRGEADDAASGGECGGPRRELACAVSFADIAAYAALPSPGATTGGAAAAPATAADTAGAAPARARTRPHHRQRSRASSSGGGIAGAAATAAAAAAATGALTADPGRPDRAFDCFEAVVGFADPPRQPSPLPSPQALLQQVAAAAADGAHATPPPAGAQPPLSPKPMGSTSSVGGSPRAGVGPSPRVGAAAGRAGETAATLQVGCSFTVHLGSGDDGSASGGGGCGELLWCWDAPPVGVPLTRNDLAAAALAARAAAAATAANAATMSAGPADGDSSSSAPQQQPQPAAASSLSSEPHDVALDLLAHRVAAAVAAGVPPQHALARLPLPAAGRLELRCRLTLAASSATPLSPPGTPLVSANAVDAATGGGAAAPASAASTRLERVLTALTVPHRLPTALLPVWGDARLRVAPWAGEAGAFLAALAAQSVVGIASADEQSGDSALDDGAPLSPHVVPTYPLLAAVAAGSPHGQRADSSRLPPSQLVSPVAVVADVVAPAAAAIASAAALSGAAAAAALLRVARLFAWEALRALAATGGGAAAPEPWLVDPPPVPVAVPWAVQLDGRVFAALADLVVGLTGRLTVAAAAEAASARTTAAAATAAEPLVECLASLLTVARAHVAHLVASRLDPAATLLALPADGDAATATATSAAAAGALPPALNRLLVAVRAATATGSRPRRTGAAAVAAEAEAVMDAGLALFCPSPTAQRLYLARHVVGRGCSSAVVELRVRWPVAAGTAAPGVAAASTDGGGGSSSGSNARAPLTARGGAAATPGGGGGAASPSPLLPPDGRLERAVLLLQAHAARCGWRHATVGAWGTSLHWLALLPLAADTGGGGGADDDDDGGGGDATASDGGGGAAASRPSVSQSSPGSTPPGVRVDLHAFLSRGLAGVLSSAGVPGWAFPRGCADPPVTFAIARDGGGGGGCSSDAEARTGAVITALAPQEGGAAVSGVGVVGSVRVFATGDGHGVRPGGDDGTAAFDAVVARTRAGLGVDGPDDAALQQLVGGGGTAASQPQATTSLLPVPVDVFGDPAWAPAAVAALEEAVRRVRLPPPLVESFAVAGDGSGGVGAAEAGAPPPPTSADGSEPASSSTAASAASTATVAGGGSSTLAALQAAALALVEELRQHASEGRPLPSAHAFAALAAAAAAGGADGAGAGDAGASDERSTATGGSGGSAGGGEEGDDDDGAYYEGYDGAENEAEDAATEDDEEEEEDEEEYEDEDEDEEGEEEEEEEEEGATDEDDEEEEEGTDDDGEEDADVVVM